MEMYYNFDLVMTYDVLLDTPQGWVAQYPSTDGNSIVAWEPHDVTYGPRQIGFFSHDSDDYGVYYRSPSLEIDALCTFTCPSAYRKLSSTSQVTCPAGHLKLEDGTSHAFCVERRCNDTSGTISFVFSFSLSSWNIVFILFRNAILDFLVVRLLTDTSVLCGPLATCDDGENDHDGFRCQCKAGTIGQSTWNKIPSCEILRCAELDCENTCVENPCAHEFEKCTTDNEPSWLYSRKVSESNSWGVMYSRPVSYTHLRAHET